MVEGNRFRIFYRIIPAIQGHFHGSKLDKYMFLSRLNGSLLVIIIYWLMIIIHVRRRRSFRFFGECLWSCIRPHTTWLNLVIFIFPSIIKGSKETTTTTKATHFCTASSLQIISINKYCITNVKCHRHQ
jgi:hypothetical protein